MIVVARALTYDYSGQFIDDRAASRPPAFALSHFGRIIAGFTADLPVTQ